MRTTLLAAPLLLMGCGAPSAGAPPESPAESPPAPDPATSKIVYIEADEETNEEARALLEEYFTASPSGDAIEAFSGLEAGDTENLSPLTCMPGLWSRLEDHPAMASDPGIMLGVMVPGATGVPGVVQGRALRSRSDHEAFWQAFHDTIALQPDHVIRKLNAQEKKVYWAIIMWDIEEPIFIVESDSYTLLVDFWMDEGEMTLAVIEDMNAWGFK